MPIPRFQLFELEDLEWFPAIIRDLARDYLVFMERRFSLHKPVLPLLKEIIAATNSSRIVDLCSGSGGPISKIADALAGEGLNMSFTLSDKFPDLQAFQEIESEHKGRISFVSESVDATAVPRHLPGLRTMFNAFHHFSPGQAVQVLRNAAEGGHPIGIFEIPDRGLHTLLPMIFLTPLIVLLATPLIRPFRWSRLFFTYIVPLAPLTIWWDGIISQLRAYNPAELEALARTVPVKNYRWRAGKVPIGTTPGHLTYLLGWATTKEIAS
jgi:hypothetical protein